MSHFKLCSVDLEATTYNELTGENKDQIDLIGFMYGDTYVHFKTVKEFWDYIDEHIIELHKYYCLAHNGGGYDFLFLVRIPDKYKENIQFDVMINGRFTEFTYKKKIKRKTYYIKFRDSYKVISSSLAKLGKAFGYPKTEMPSWRENQKRGLSFEEHYNQSIIYNRNDCEILIKIMDKFLNDDTFKYLKTMPLTISSLALKTFKHMKGIKRLCELSNASYHDEYLRKAYSGGRTEVFKMQIDEDYSYLDVNCYSEDTEFWTNEGWKNINDLSNLSPLTKVLTFNFNKNVMEYKKINDFVIKEYAGIMFNFKGENSDVLVTPNHRIYHYCRSTKNKNYNWDLENIKTKEAKDVHKEVMFKATGVYKEGFSYYNKDLIKLMAWIITEGNYSKYALSISQSDHYNSEYINEIRSILKRLDIPYRETFRGKRKANFNGYEFHINKEYASQLKSLIPDKTIPNWWITNWNMKDLKILFWTLLKGDGSFRRQRGKATFVSSKNDELDKMQMIATKIGIKSSVSYKHNVIYFKLHRGCNATVSKSEEYYKGRVWCLNVDNNNFLVRRNGKVCFQGNSLYPSQMLKPLPVGKVHKFTSWFNVNEAYNNRMAGVYEVKWKAPEMHTPILWERKDFQHASKLIFGLNRKTNKEGKGYYALPELLLAEEHGYSIKPISCVVADETEPIFKEYVETFIQMKYKGGAKKEIAKLLLNSLYGKTGQRLMTQTSGTLSPETAFKKQEIYVANIASLNNAIEANASPHIIDELSNRVKNSRFYCIDKDLELYNYTAKKDHRDTNVMWASYITAFARCELWKACKTCDFEQAYVDTDSCIMPMEYKKKMPVHEKELGKWKEEGVVHKGKFYAPKSYIMDITCENLRQTKVVMKGVDREILRKYYKYDPELDKSYIPYTDYNTLINTFKPNASFNTIKVTPFKQSRRMKLESGVARDITKILNLNYDKRLVLDDGNTLPY